MIFRQLFDSVSSTYSYVLASRKGGEALIIDPVLEKVDRYIQLLNELDLKLLKAVDTHLHADHVTGLGALRDRTLCVTVMGEQTKYDVVSMRVGDGETVDIEGLQLGAIYTPGHTDDSYSYTMADRVFTGIRCSSAAPAAPISKTAMRGSNMIPSSTDCSSCPKTRSSIPRTTTHLAPWRRSR